MFTWPRRVPPELVPQDVAEILRRAVVEDPRARFADAAQFRRAVVTALSRHAPGYDAEHLARDLKRLRGELVDFGSDVGETTDVATELRAARPRLSLVDRTPTPARAAATLTPGAATLPVGATSTAPTNPHPIGARTLPSPEPLLYDDGELLGPRPSRGLVLAIAAAAGTALLLAIIIAIAGGQSRVVVPQPPAHAADAPRAIPLSAPRATVGILEVSGPAGARPSIGAVVYPPAPCTFELPPGEYDVRLHAKRRVITRHVSIEAGHTTSL
jgi:hypothetical protein